MAYDQRSESNLVVGNDTSLLKQIQTEVKGLRQDFDDSKSILIFYSTELDEHSVVFLIPTKIITQQQRNMLLLLNGKFICGELYTQPFFVYLWLSLINDELRLKNINEWLKEKEIQLGRDIY